MAEEKTFKGIIETSTGLSIEFTPWTDNNMFKITKLHLYEDLGGKLAHGNVDLIRSSSEEALKLITEQNTGTIVLKNNKPGGLTYEIPVFISSRSHLKYGISLELNCIPDIDFLTKRITETYDDIESAIDLTYPGKKDIRTKPDSSVTSNKEVQNYQTNAEFCSRLCGSFKQGIVYAFGWEGLLIKDIVGKDSFGNDEPNIILENGVSMTMASCHKYNYNYNLNEINEPFRPFSDSEKSITGSKDYIESEPINVTAILSKDEYHIVGKDYLSHLSNWKYNQRIFDSNLYSSFIIKGVDMPNFKLGDVITFYQSRSDTDAQTPYKYFLVKSNEFFYSNEDSDTVDQNGLKLSWTTMLVGLEDGDWSNTTDNKQ